MRVKWKLSAPGSGKSGPAEIVYKAAPSGHRFAAVLPFYLLDPAGNNLFSRKKLVTLVEMLSSKLAVKSKLEPSGAVTEVRRAL